MARMSRLRPINSVKNVVDSEGAILAATTSTSDLVIGVRTLATTINPIQVPVGAVVNSIFLSVYILGSGGSDSEIINWYIAKNPNNSLTLPAPGATGASANRRWILHEEKGIYATQDGTPMVFKGVIRIPPKMRRIGDGDRISVLIRSTLGVPNFCIKAIYKFIQ